MKTTATNRKIRVLISAINSGALVPQPEFQRRLVWSNRHKRAFLDTVLKGYPFPEIYIAAGKVNPDTAEGTEMLVDGQQRITTLHQYFSGSEDLVLDGEIPPYSQLESGKKSAFLEYEVVVRDLGSMGIEEIREVFERINSTKYALNAMEIHNARYEGEFKKFGEDFAENDFFEKYRVFTASDMKRMHDVRFGLVVAATCLSTYFDGDSELEHYLEHYNDAFPDARSLRKQLERVLKTIESCGFPADTRVWKKPDLFTLIVEVYRAQVDRAVEINPALLAKRLLPFYKKIDNIASKEKDPSVLEYYKASAQGTNHRGNRIARGRIIEGFIESAAD